MSARPCPEEVVNSETNVLDKTTILHPPGTLRLDRSRA